MTTVLLSRLQFALTTLFHMIFPLLSVGLSAFLFLMEALWISTGKKTYYLHCRFWSRIFIINFAVGVASGLVLEFQFGTNWAAFSAATGGFFGDILGFEGTMAFMLEAAFIGIMLFGWNRISKPVHLAATGLVAFGASLSAFWILVANSWMQTPAGGVFRGGVFIVTDYFKAIMNPDMPWGTSHMWAACVETTIFVIGGVSAWYVLKGRKAEFFLGSLKVVLVAAVVITPLQIFLGDGSGRSVAVTQPAKIAAMEAHWQTNPKGQGAPWAIVAWPDSENDRNAWSLEIPYALSILTTHTLTGQVRGLSEFPPEDRPPILIPFYSFRFMVLIGFLLFFLMIWSLVLWFRGKLSPQETLKGTGKWFFRSWIAAIPAGYLAVEFGWATREVGRQPWVIYGMLRTSDGASRLPQSTVGISLLLYLAVYALLFTAFLIFTGRIVLKGPDLDLPLPERKRT